MPSSQDQNAVKRTTVMALKTQQNFLNADGSINTERAMNAGHEARSLALYAMIAAVIRLIRVASTSALKRRGNHATAP
jgi:hypothetical protein